MTGKMCRALGSSKTFTKTNLFDSHMLWNTACSKLIKVISLNVREFGLNRPWTVIQYDLECCCRYSKCSLSLTAIVSLVSSWQMMAPTLAKYPMWLGRWTGHSDWQFMVRKTAVSSKCNFKQLSKQPFSNASSYTSLQFHLSWMDHSGSP